MNITRPVGKGCFAETSDNLVVQTGLANIKNKRGRPHYQGKLDGRKSPALECAIAEFEAENGFPVTYKMEAYGAKWNCFKRKIPNTIQQKLASGIVTTASVSSHESLKAEQKAKKSCEVIRKASLPGKERDALDALVAGLGKDGVPLNLKEISISADGCFQVGLEIDPSVLPAGAEKEKLKKALIGKVCDRVGESNTWQKGATTNLTFKSKRSFPCFKNLPAPSADHAKALGLSGLIPGDPVLNTLMTAAVKTVHREQSFSDLSIGDDIPGVKEKLVEASSLKPEVSILTEEQEERLIEDLKANGCGTKDGFPVPDAPFVDFKPACDQHDLNYSTLGFPKEEADEIFLQDMLQICEDFRNRYIIPFLLPALASYSVCVSIAYSYYYFVSNLGDPFYKEAQEKAKKLENLDK